MSFTVKDPYGTPITNGAKVAYNFQGEVRLGTVLEIKNVTKNGKKVNEWSHEPYVSILIDMLVVGPEHARRSKVANRKNLVVIK
jgi:hypothetical protein